MLETEQKALLEGFGKLLKRGEADPKLRHEFVGMMFAITIGEIGIQAAELVQAKHGWHYLPAYFHLFLATFVVAASWVGWSRSAVPGARKDTREIFEWAFTVLLLDMAMVVTYFILVRTVDFSNEHHRTDSAHVVAGWHVLIFLLYFVWDVVTKVMMYEREDEQKPDEEKSYNIGWFAGWAEGDAELKEERKYRILRTIPTLICLIASIILWRTFTEDIDEHLLTADIALLSVVLLFRALKSQMSAFWPSPSERKRKRPRRILFRTVCTILCLLGLAYGTLTTVKRWAPPVTESVVQEIRTPISE